VNSGVKTLSGTHAHPVHLAGKFYGSQSKATEIYLGEAKTDEDGRLVVLAGRGHSRSVADVNQPYPLIMNDFDSPDWIDDTCDGWVHVEVIHTASQEVYVTPIS
jgi:L-Lysine epsilon oxidase N-terminal